MVSIRGRTEEGARKEEGEEERREGGIMEGTVNSVTTGRLDCRDRQGRKIDFKLLFTGGQ